MATIASLVVKISADTKQFVSEAKDSAVVSHALKAALIGAGAGAAKAALGFGTLTVKAAAARGAMFGLVGGTAGALVGVTKLGDAIAHAAVGFSRLVVDVARGSVSFAQVGGHLSAIAAQFAKSATIAYLWKPTLIGVGIAALVITPSLIGLSKASVTLAAEFEQLEVSFGTMLKSVPKAKALLSDISDFAASTPFEFGELSNASRSLIAFGVAQRDLIPTLRSIGDVSAAVGQNIGEVAEIYGKAKVQGRLFAEDINQLTGRGIPVIQELAKQFGVTDDKVKLLVKDGQVEFKHLEKAFQSLTGEGGRFAGMMAKQSQTIKGLTSTMKDEFGIALRDVGKALVNGLGVKEAIRGFTDFASVLRETAGWLAVLSKYQLGGTPGQVVQLGGQMFKNSTGLSGVQNVQAGLNKLFQPDPAIAKKLERDRLAAIAAREESQKKAGLPGLRATNEFVKAGFLDSLGQAGSIEMLKERHKKAAKLVHEVVLDWFGPKGALKDFERLNPRARGVMETVGFRSATDIAPGLKKNFVDGGIRFAAAAEAGSAAAYSASLREGMGGSDPVWAKKLVEEERQQKRLLNDIERNTNKLKVTEVAIA